MVKSILLGIAIAYTIALTTASLINIGSVPELGFSFDDKIYHFIAYLGLAFLWLTYVKTFYKNTKLIFVFLILVLFGVVLELVQHQVNPNRVYDTFDLIANCLGVIVGTLIANSFNILKLK